MPRVLYVEDHADTREAIAQLLIRAGYDVEIAASGSEALDHAFSEPPDLILLDLALPKMDGIELVRILRSYLRLSEIPVVVLSALSEGPLIEAARTLNISSILIKSQTSFDQILRALRRALLQNHTGGHPRPETRPHDDSPRP
ncbi:MAG TPA: response regulator [Tepidisphaeraceae bacterium]|nr:response regulator [Tepidisphaeraceae bacterium]